mgnify:CR=1 FL=1
MTTATQEGKAAGVLASIMERKPAGACALIVAELEHNESDSMTDYFGSRTVRRVAIGWRTGKREDFKQLRRAAAGFAETAHLGPGKDLYRVWVYREEDKGADTYRPSQPLRPEGNYNTREEAEAAVAAIRDTDTQDGICIRHFGYRVECESVEHRDNYSMGKGNWLGCNRYSGWCVQSVTLPLSSYMGNDIEDAIPRTKAPEHKPYVPPAPNAVTADAYTIEKHYHTKGAFDMWLVLPRERLTDEGFKHARARCELAGGWYSRRWGTTPGGFAFKDQAKAEAWAAEQFGGQAPTPPTDPKPETREERASNTANAQAAINKGRAEKFRSMAETLGQKIENLRRPGRLENTPKRQREGMAARCEAANLERVQRALLALAQGWETVNANGVCGMRVAFQQLTTKAQIEPLVTKRTESSGYYDVHESDEYRDNSKLAQDLREYVKNAASDEHKASDEQRTKAEALKALENEVRFLNIPGFFPTPAPVIDRMMSGLSAGCTLLDPSAGIGSILDQFCAAYPGIKAAGFEVVPKLADICKRKGHAVECCDFLEQMPPATGYDAVAMNPPFEKRQAWAHIRHAWAFVGPGGWLRAIAPANVPEDFREWVEGLGGTIEDMPADSFKGSDAFRETGVACVLVEIVRE